MRREHTGTRAHEGRARRYSNTGPHWHFGTHRYSSNLRILYRTRQLAADFRFKLFQGEDVLGASELDISELYGRPLILNFWARFCTPCWTEMPELQAFYEEYSDRVQLVGVDVGQFTGLGSPKDASKLLESLGVTYPAGYTDDAMVVRNYGIRGMPTTIFISSEGTVLRAWSGSITREQLEVIVNTNLLEE